VRAWWLKVVVRRTSQVWDHQWNFGNESRNIYFRCCSTQQMSSLCMYVFPTQYRRAPTTMRPLTTVENKWLFTEQQLEATPSRRDGISLEIELARRKEMIQLMGVIAQQANRCAQSLYTPASNSNLRSAQRTVQKREHMADKGVHDARRDPSPSILYETLPSRL
jgi:hypothetical protein